MRSARLLVADKPQNCALLVDQLVLCLLIEIDFKKFGIEVNIHG